MLWCMKHDCSHIYEFSNKANFLSCHDKRILHDGRTRTLGGGGGGGGGGAWELVREQALACSVHYGKV